ncbi:baseplate hub [Listeria phage LIS04]|nr:baseplate hub [Listeria phage LIS04]
MADYNVTLKLPSLGLLNPEIGESVTIRNMTTAEEKLLLGSTAEALDSVLNRCIVEPKIDVNSLISPDKHFILIQLRILSYGPDYYVKHKCPNCQAVSEYKIDLEKDLEIHYLDSNFTEPYAELTLPQSGDEVTLRLPRVSEILDADKKARKHKKKFPKHQGDIAYIYRLMCNIDTVGGEELTSIKLQNYIEEMHTRDLAYIKNEIAKVEVGVDVQIYEECPSCSEDVEFSMPINGEFFSTRF